VAYRLAVFDFDGTLVDTRKPIALAANRALAHAGYAPRADADVWDLVGRPLAGVLGRLAGERDRIEELCAAYRAAFREVAPGRSPLFAGVREALDELAGAGLPLAIATSRSRESLEAFLDEHELRGRFAFWAGGACIRNGKPHPEMLEYVLARTGFAPADAVMVGDTTHDMEMARAARVDACAVTWGMHDRARLVSSRPAHLVHDMRELPRVVLSRA